MKALAAVDGSTGRSGTDVFAAVAAACGLL